MELALDEVNAAGGVLGRKLEIVMRDDNGTPGDAVRVAEELVSREKVVMLMGTFASNVGLAVADFAKQRKMPFLASEPLTDKIVWDNGNKYTYRLRASTFMQTAMLVPEAAKLGKKRWAIVYPNYEYGQSATAAFKKQMNAQQTGGSSSSSRRCRSARSIPAPVVQALLDAQPDAIFSSLFGPDLARFVREGQLRGLFKDRPGVQPARRRAGVPRSAEGRGAGRLVRHGLSVVRDRDARAQEVPRRLPGELQRLSAPGLGGRLQRRDRGGRGHQEGGLDRSREDRRGAVGPAASARRSARTFRPIDHQSTMGAYVGRTAVKDGKGVMVDWKYADGKDYLPTDAVVRSCGRKS